MNQSEKNYIVKRLAGIHTQKIELARASCTTYEVEYSPEKRFELFKQGKYKLRHKGNPFESDHYSYFKNAFVFEGERPETLNRAEYDQIVGLLNKEFDRVKDEIMLGDAQDALELLKKFENFKPVVKKGK